MVAVIRIIGMFRSDVMHLWAIMGLTEEDLYESTPSSRSAPVTSRTETSEVTALKQRITQLEETIRHLKSAPPNSKSQEQAQQVHIHMGAPESSDPKKIRQILDGLDERLALGEISEDRYVKLKKKWEQKLG